MALAPGARLGPYEILSVLGEGGMGEVWKARDTRLDRLVAIKTSESRFSERFDREARAIAAVNHPHVCSLYDVGPDYLVMEYVEGEWLRGPVPIARALELADQILDAIDAAHEKGVVHRDLKPGNILLTKSGVKVLDFGLAKVGNTSVADARCDADTRSVSLTAEGSVLGTLPYMSPEQVEGREADARSDIFAFGIVLYELIAGARPFAGETSANLVASILKEEPRPLNEVQPETPRGLAQVVRTCLEKDPEKRWQSARDVRHALALVAVEPPPAVRRPSVRVWQALAAMAVIAALGMGGWMLRPAPPGPLSRLEVPVPENAILGDAVSVSPDGRRVAVTSGGVWLRDLADLEWRRLPGTEGAFSPFWSPDGRYLGFMATGSVNTVKKIDVAGGPPETMASLPDDASFWTGAWSANGDILLGSWGGGSGGPLWRVQAGVVSPVTTVDLSKGEFYHTSPTFLPDGRRFLYFRSGPPDIEGMYVGSLDADAGSQSRQRVLTGRVPATYAHGHVLFPREGTVMAQPFDIGRLEPQGTAVPVAENVRITWFHTGLFAASDTGVLAYRTASAPETFELTWVDRQGKALSTVGPPGPGQRAALSPDGTRVVVKDAPYDVAGDLWTLDVATGRRMRLTFTSDVYSPGVWSPDGDRIAYSAGQLGDTVYVRAASGQGEAQVLLKEPGLRLFPTSWAGDGDGQFLLYHTQNAPRTGYDIWALSLRDRQPHLLIGEAVNEWAGVFSPDMRWVAYVSLNAGIFVRPFRVSAETGLPSLGEDKWQVSTYGNWPRWRHAGEIVFNNAPSGTAVFAVPVKANGAVFESGEPERLPFAPNAGVDSTPLSSPDGQRFLIEVAQTPVAAPTSISVVLNWPSLMKR